MSLKFQGSHFENLIDPGSKKRSLEVLLAILRSSRILLGLVLKDLRSVGTLLSMNSQIHCLLRFNLCFSMRSLTFPIGIYIKYILKKLLKVIPKFKSFVEHKSILIFLQNILQAVLLCSKNKGAVH